MHVSAGWARATVPRGRRFLGAGEEVANRPGGVTVHGARSVRCTGQDWSLAGQHWSRGGALPTSCHNLCRADRDHPRMRNNFSMSGAQPGILKVVFKLNSPDEGATATKGCFYWRNNGPAEPDEGAVRRPSSDRLYAFFWPFSLCSAHSCDYHEGASLGGGSYGLWGAGGASKDACVCKGAASGRRWHAGISARSWVDVPTGSRQAPRNIHVILEIFSRALGGLVNLRRSETGA